MTIKGNSGMRSSFSGTVTLGLVSFPVKFVVATKENGVSFHQLHGKCSSRIQQKVYCPVCAVNVERADLVRGFEVEKDRNRSEQHTSELQSRQYLVCRLLLE